LLVYAAQKGIQLLLPEPGKPIEVKGQAYNSEWWKK